MTPATEALAPAVATGAAAVIAATAEPVLPGVGVAASTFLAACTGALIGLAYVKPETWEPFKAILAGDGTRASRRALALAGHGLALVFMLLAVAVISAWAVAVAPHIPLLAWTANVPRMPAAGLLAAGGQYFIPAAFAAGKRRLDSWGGAPK